MLERAFVSEFETGAGSFRRICIEGRSEAGEPE